MSSDGAGEGQIATSNALATTKPRRKPGPKDSPEVTRRRVEELISTLESTGWTKRIELDFSKRWEIGCRQVRWLKKKAVDSIAVSLKPADRARETAQHIARTRAAFDLAMVSKDAGAAVRVLRHEAQVLGLLQPTEIVITGDLRGLSEAELDVRAAKLKAAEGVAS